jgi:hypothetical protein
VTAAVLPPLMLEDLFPLIHRGTLPCLAARDLADTAAAIERRRLDEVHGCALCGERACSAFAFGPSDLIGSARWLDLCPPHSHALRLMAGRLSCDLVTDDEIIRRYEAWLRTR